MKETFGAFIRQLRTNEKLTLTQLAAQLDMDSGNLSKIENGKRDIDEKRLEKLASLFKLDLEKITAEYFSEIIAKKIYRIDCAEETLILAEQKIKYFKNKNSKQGELNI